MKGLIQRVRHARVEVAGEIVGAIDQGLLVLVGVEREDDQARADKLLHKLLNYRVFGDEQGKMNRSLKDIGGGLLLVSQFTLPRTPAAACARASPVQRRLPTARRCTTTCWRVPATSIQRWPVGVSAPRCRCTSSTTGR